MPILSIDIAILLRSHVAVWYQNCQSNSFLVILVSAYFGRLYLPCWQYAWTISFILWTFAVLLRPCFGLYPSMRSQASINQTVNRMP